MNNSTILLTGATGFLGSKILEKLLNNNYKVIIFKRSKSNTFRIDHFIKSIKSYDVDIESHDKAFKEQHIDYVIHTACMYDQSPNHFQELTKSNLGFGLEILDSCLKYKVKGFLNSDTFLQKNLNAYTLSKKQFVEWLKFKSDEIQVVNMKIELMYGPKDDSNKFIPWVISQLNRNVKKISLTTGVQKRDFIYVEDVVTAYITILNKLNELPRFSEFEVGLGQSINVKEFLELLKRVYISKYGDTNTKFAYGEVAYRTDENMEVKVNNKSLINLGWKPKINLLQGLEKVLEEKI